MMMTSRPEKRWPLRCEARCTAMGGNSSRRLESLPNAPNGKKRLSPTGDSFRPRAPLDVPGEKCEHPVLVGREPFDERVHAGEHTDARVGRVARQSAEVE